MSVLSDFITRRISHLQHEKFTPSRRTIGFDGRLELDERSRHQYVQTCIDQMNEPSKESKYLKQREAYLRDRWGGLELENKPAKAEGTNLLQVAESRARQESQGFQDVKGMVGKRDGELVGLALSIKL